MPDQGITRIDISDTVTLRLSVRESVGLDIAASGRGMSRDEWVSALISAHVGRRPTWNSEEVVELQTMGDQIKQLATLVQAEIVPVQTGAVQCGVMIDRFDRMLHRITDSQRAYWAA